MEERKWCVYKHTDKINGKCYIGITWNIKERWSSKGKKYKGYFGSAIKKYGWDNFEHQVLYENLSREDACKKEIELIKKYNTFVPNGYNLTKGGEGSLGFEISDETRYKMSKVKLGKNNPFYKKKHTKEWINMISEINKENKSIPILQIDPKTKQVIKEYDSITDASKELGCTVQAISRCLNKKTNSSMGYIWHYKNENYSNEDFEMKNNKTKRVGKFNKDTEELLKIYGSIVEAGKDNNIKPHNISNTIIGNQKTSGGFIWRLII